MAAMKPLVIVESPAKAKTIGAFLGSSYTVKASVGHVVDLPQSGLAIDVENGFAPTYEVTKKDVMKDLRESLKHASELYLATDEDREGEAIAWHLKNQLKPKVPVKRMVFHEITRSAIEHAVSNWRDIDESLVNAQDARRVLDRLYGYEVSPVLWRKVKTGLSAGRVQSPAIRLIVERERERMRFRAVTYWDVEASHPLSPAFTSTLSSLDGVRVAQGRDFDQQGKVSPGVRWVDEALALGLTERLAGRSFTVAQVDKKPYRSSPRPPFITSTLQQEAGRKLNLSAQQVMRVAQSLYENGYITYMRTDSTNLSDTALSAARAQVKELFGAEFLPPAPRTYQRKVKNAQEAHEAIRPAGDAFRTPDELKGHLGPLEHKVYELIWKRTLACQMADAEGETMSLKLAGASSAGEKVEFSASGRTITFRGYMRAYIESVDEGAQEGDEAVLPALSFGDVVPVESLEAKGHTTSPPARYTEASLVKKLEELGIGRPSTFASIIGTLQAKYVWKRGQALIPNWEAFATVQLMEKHFPDLVDYDFTAEMNGELDEIANKERERTPYLQQFYFGDGKHQGLKPAIDANIERIDAAQVNSIGIGKDPAGVDIVVKPGKYGPYLRRGEDTVGVPDTLPPDELTVERALQLLSAPKGDTPIGQDAASGRNVYVKQGRYGAYVQLGENDEDDKKTASLFRSMKVETVTVAEALKLLSLPRKVGVAPDGDEVVAQNGRYGPYVTKGKESRNLGAEAEERLLTLTLEEALEIFKQPKQFRGRGQPKPPLATFKDVNTGKDLVLKEGRFGFYVTDGETNASLRRGDDPGELNAERASELLQERREYLASNPQARAKAGRGKGRSARAPRPKAAKAGTDEGKAQAGKAAKSGKAAKVPKASKEPTAPKPKVAKAARVVKAPRAALTATVASAAKSKRKTA